MQGESWPQAARRFGGLADLRSVSAGWRTFGPLRRRFAPPGLRPEPALRGDFLLPLSLFRQLAAYRWN